MQVDRQKAAVALWAAQVTCYEWHVKLRKSKESAESCVLFHASPPEWNGKGMACIFKFFFLCLSPRSISLNEHKLSTHILQPNYTQNPGIKTGIMFNCVKFHGT